MAPSFEASYHEPVVDFDVESFIRFSGLGITANDQSVGGKIFRSYIENGGVKSKFMAELREILAGANMSMPNCPEVAREMGRDLCSEVKVFCLSCSQETNNKGICSTAGCCYAGPLHSSTSKKLRIVHPRMLPQLVMIIRSHLDMFPSGSTVQIDVNTDGAPLVRKG